MIDSGIAIVFCEKIPLKMTRMETKNKIENSYKTKHFIKIIIANLIEVLLEEHFFKGLVRRDISSGTIMIQLTNSKPTVTIFKQHF